MSRRAVLVTVAVIVAILAAAVWALSLDATLQWAVREAQARSGGKLSLEKVSGSLLYRVRADRVVWKGDTTTVVAEPMQVRWSPLWLFAGVVAFDKVDVGALTVTSTAANQGPTTLPHDLRLRMRLRFDDGRIGRLALVDAEGGERAFRDIALSLAGGRDRWSLELAETRVTWGTLHGHVEVGTDLPFALKGAASLDPKGRASDVPPVSIDAKASGNLSSFSLDLDGKAQSSAASAKLQIEPLQPIKVRAIDATLHDVDVRHLFPDAPEAVLDGTMKAQTDQDGILRGTLAVDNRAAGTIDRHRVPFEKLRSKVVAAPKRWWLEGLSLEAGAAGTLTGTGWVSADETGAVLITDDFDLHGVHSSVKPTHLEGNLFTSGPFDRQQMRIALSDRRIALAADAVLEPAQLTVRDATIRAAGGRFDASGTLSRDEHRAFTLKTAFKGLDPSQLGDYHKADINGRLSASGELAPVLRLRAEGALGQSKLFGLSAAGEMRWVSKSVNDPTISFDGKVTLGQTRIAARGSIRDPKDPKAVDLVLDLRGDDLQQIYTITGLPFPSTPPYSLSGRLGLQDQVWSLRGFEGKVGRSDLAGNFSVDLRGKRPLMRADLASQNLDMRDLGGFLGVDYHAPDPAPGKLLPHREYSFAKLNAANVDIRFTGRRIANARLPLERMTARLRLDGGRATLDPLRFGAAGGDIDARIAMDARSEPIRTRADVQVRRLQLAKLAPGVRAVLASAGTIDGRTELAMTGNSMAQMLGGADGQLVLAMNGGSISDLLLRLADLDLANALVAMSKGDPNIPIRCAIADFSAQDGVLRPRSLLLDTAHTLVRGEGTVDLGSEQLALRLIAEPKDPSLFALRGPIRIDGAFAHPAVHPELGNAIARIGASVALGVVATPFAAIIPFLQAGDRQKVDCAPLILDASRFIQSPPLASNGERAKRERGETVAHR